MNSPSAPTNAYTDAPELRRNLLLGSLQLPFWLFFHPSAWRNHISRVDSTLRPDFCLAELSRRQLSNPALRRLLVMAYVVCPLLVSVPVGLGLWLSYQFWPFDLFWVYMQLGVIGAVVGCFVGSVGVGAGVGVAAGVAGGLAGAMAGGVALFDSQDSVMSVAFGVACGVASSTAANLVNSKTVHLHIKSGHKMPARMFDQQRNEEHEESHNRSAPKHPSHSSFLHDLYRSLPLRYRQIGKIIFGFLLSVLTLILAVEVLERLMINGFNRSVLERIRQDMGNFTRIFFLGAVGITLAVGVRARRWRLGALGSVAKVLVFWGMIFVPLPLPETFSGESHLNNIVGNFRMAVFFGYTFAEMFSVMFSLPYALAERMVGSWAGPIAGMFSGVAGLSISIVVLNASYNDINTTLRRQYLATLLISLLLGFTLRWWRPVVLYPLLAAWNAALYRADERRSANLPSLLRWHSAFWDDLQRIPLWGLDKHLLLVMERNSAEGQAAAEYLAAGRQRWAVRDAQIELDVRRLERCANVEEISRARQRLAADELEGPASALLRSFSRISQDVDAALHQGSDYNQRLALSAVEERLDNLLRELTRSNEPYAERFSPVTIRWRQIVADRACELAEAAELRQEIDSPYIIGVPLTERQEIFVGRTDVSARIEQLLLDRRRPPLLLYGQRRMGKTSLLNNLGRLLPSTIVPLFVDLQGPASQSGDHTGFLYNIARGMTESANRHRGLPLPALSREALADDPFTSFDEWLDDVERVLGSNTALLILDEFESLDDALTMGRFSETAVLGMLRHLIQHRLRFKVLLAGSHTLDELSRWAGYLINVQVVKLGYLNEVESLRLLERPVKDFTLSYEPEASRRVLDLTRGHPFLTQLLCAEIVALKNEQETSTRRRATPADVEAATPEAISHGSFFFADIQRNQVDSAGLAVLRFMAAKGEGCVASREDMSCQFADPIEQTLDSLLRRDLIEPANGGFRFQVEMIRRWFAQTGSSFGKIESL